MFWVSLTASALSEAFNVYTISCTIRLRPSADRMQVDRRKNAACSVMPCRALLGSDKWVRLACMTCLQHKTIFCEHVLAQLNKTSTRTQACIDHMSHVKLWGAAASSPSAQHV